MRKPRPTGGEYVRKVQEDTRRYSAELLGENERLRLYAATLETERARLEGELSRARDDADRSEREQLRLQHRLSEIESETRRFAERYVEVETQNANLANLYVASYRLHSTLERGEVLTAIQEIIANLIGCEEFAIFEMNTNASELQLIASCGIEEARWQTVAVGSGIIGHAAKSGLPYRAPVGAPSEGVTNDHMIACFPLVLDGQVTGAIALFRLLQQKRGLAPVDEELFDLLATHAATSLYCTQLHAQRRSAPDHA